MKNVMCHYFCNTLPVANLILIENLASLKLDFEPSPQFYVNDIRSYYMYFVLNEHLATNALFISTFNSNLKPPLVPI